MTRAARALPSSLGSRRVRSAIEAEFAGEHATAVDKECLHYVLHERAGTNQTAFGGVIRDADSPPKSLDDFVHEMESKG